MLLLFIAIITLIYVLYYINNNESNSKTIIKKLNECPDVLTSKCDPNPCNCPDQMNKPKYKITTNINGKTIECNQCGKKCVTEINEPNNIFINATNENYIVNDIKLNSDGTLSYTPEYAYLEGEMQDCICDNNNTPVKKTIIIQDNNGEIVEKTGYICGGNEDGSRKYKNNDLTKDIFIKMTEDRTMTLEPKTETDISNIEIIDEQISSNKDDLKKDFSANVKNIINSNVNTDNINNIKQQVNDDYNSNISNSKICPNTHFAPYIDKTTNKWVINSDYIFEGNRQNELSLACNTDNICDCPNNDEMLWKIRNNEGGYDGCKTCGKLICPNDEDVDIFKYTNSNGNSTILNCSEIMYNGLKDADYDNYLNKCQCGDGRQLKRRVYDLDGKKYTCDTCEEIVNACPANITLDQPNFIDRCTLDSSCQCPRDSNGQLLVKYETLYYGTGNMNIKDKNDVKYKSCYVCGLPINSRIYNLCDDKITCNISHKLQTLLNDIDNEIRTQTNNNKKLYPFENDSIKQRITEYINGTDKELDKLDNKCLPKHTITNLFYDILENYSINYIDTGNELTKRNSCAEIARMSSEIDSGDGVNCRYNYDEDELYTIMGQLTYDKDYKVSNLYDKPTEDKKKLSNIIKSYSDDLYDFNNVLRNCKVTCNEDYKKIYGIDTTRNVVTAGGNDNNNTDNWPSDVCQNYAKLYCPSYANISDNSYDFSKRVYDFCSDKDNKCTALTYIKHNNNNYINNKVKKICPSSCWKCDEHAVANARNFIKYHYPDGTSKEKESEIMAAFVNESKQLREQINTGLDVLTSRSGFTKYIDDLKFNILDMVNRWDFKYQLSTDKDLFDKCKQDLKTTQYKLEDTYQVSNFLELANCHIVDSIDKIETRFKSDKNEILNGIYGYCKTPENSNWMTSIMESCANSSPNESSPICNEIDNSNSFPFKLDGVKDCFGSTDISDSDSIISCINNKMSNACIGDVRELQDSYNAKCRHDFEKCVQSMACGAIRNYEFLPYVPSEQCANTDCHKHFINFDKSAYDQYDECHPRKKTFWESIGVGKPDAKNQHVCNIKTAKYNECKICHDEYKLHKEKEREFNKEYIEKGMVDNTKIAETQKNNPLCRKCVNDAFDCTVRNQWNKKRHTKYPSNVPYTEHLYKVDNCPINNEICTPVIRNNNNDFSKYKDIFNETFGFTSNDTYTDDFKKDVNDNFINCENTLRQCISPHSCSVLKNRSMKSIFDTINNDYKNDDECIKCAWNSNSCIHFNNVKNTCEKHVGADLVDECWDRTKEWVNKRREYTPPLTDALDQYDCLPTTTLCKPPKPGSLDFSFWVNDKHEIIPEREEEFKWYINNWWKGYPDDNPNCKGKWVLKYNNEYCDTKTCNVTDMSFYIQINDNITKHMANSKYLTKYLNIAINEYIYQHQIGTYDHIDTFLSKILWLTKYKADPNPECGTVYDKYLFNDLIILINKIKNEEHLKSGLSSDFRLQFNHMLTRLGNVKPENKYCRKGSKTYLTGNSKISNVDLSYLLSSKKFLYFDDYDIKKSYNSSNPDDVITNVTLTNDNIATFKVEFKNITFDVADKIKNIFNTQNLQKYDSTNPNLFIKFLFNSFGYFSGNNFKYVFKNLLNDDQKKYSMVKLIDDIKLNNLSGIKSSNYVWLYEKEDASQLIDCDLARIRGFMGEFENLNIDIDIGQTYSGMVACEKNTALFFEENKCNLQQLVSEKKIPCSDHIIEREKHNNPTISKTC